MPKAKKKQSKQKKSVPPSTTSLTEAARPLEPAADSGEGEIIGTGSADTWDYQPDPEVVEVLAETEREETTHDEAPRATAEYSAVSPRDSGGDVDADWERAQVTGEEAVGGSVATPDQDNVDELGAAWGIAYSDEEPIDTIEKMDKRDRQRGD